VQEPAHLGVLGLSFAEHALGPPVRDTAIVELDRANRAAVGARSYIKDADGGGSDALLDDGST
jgi:hypothetical protein